jgi:hypothetical protein
MAPLAAPEPTTAPIAVTPPFPAREVTASATAMAPFAALEAAASGIVPAPTAEPHTEMLPVSTETAPPVTAPTQDPVEQNAPVADLKSTGGTDVVSSQSESDADNGASVVKNVGLTTENGASDAQGYKPAESPSFADTVRTLQPAEIVFLLIGLSIIVFLVAIVSRTGAKRREPIISDYSDQNYLSRVIVGICGGSLAIRRLLHRRGLPN